MQNTISFLFKKKKKERVWLRRRFTGLKKQLFLVSWWVELLENVTFFCVSHFYSAWICKQI